MPGDLNIKKSWHPSLAKNRAKVAEKEREALDERRKTVERQKEIAQERELSELRALQGGPQKSKLSWMYDASPTVSKEPATNDDILMGKRQVEATSLAEQKATRSARSAKVHKSSADPMAQVLGLASVSRSGMSKSKKSADPTKPRSNSSIRKGTAPGHKR